MKIDTSVLLKVRVYPDGSNHLIEDYPTPCSYMSDDYETRDTAYCEECDSNLHIHHGEPLASCDCGTQEWYK
jgi:hypothetical protein